MCKRLSLVLSICDCASSSLEVGGGNKRAFPAPPSQHYIRPNPRYDSRGGASDLQEGKPAPSPPLLRLIVRLSERRMEIDEAEASVSWFGYTSAMRKERDNDAS